MLQNAVNCKENTNTYYSSLSEINTKIFKCVFSFFLSAYKIFLMGSCYSNCIVACFFSSFILNILLVIAWFPWLAYIYMKLESTHSINNDLTLAYLTWITYLVWKPNREWWQGAAWSPAALGSGDLAKLLPERFQRVLIFSGIIGDGDVEQKEWGRMNDKEREWKRQSKSSQQ